MLPVNVASLCLLLVACGMAGPAAIARVAPRAAVSTVPLVLTPFDYRGVSLDGGRLKSQFDEVRAYYLAIPNDNLLKGFRSRAGLPAPGTNLGGWYSSDTFHVFGQILSGLSRMYAATGDEACGDKVRYLVSEWARCIEPDGYFYYSRSPNARQYTYDKTVCGLIDAYHYAGVDEALTHLDTITSWARVKLARGKPDTDIDGTGPWEWYTLTENLYRAYQYTGDLQYRDFGKEWEYKLYWNAYADGTDIFSLLAADQNYHAYSHVNTLSGAAMAYRLTGDAACLDTIRNAHDYLVREQAWATGGYGPHEILLRPSLTADPTWVLDLWNNHFETMCGSWAVFKLCKSLMTLTGMARYGDSIEAVLWNGIGASIPMSADGETQYYSHYHLGGAAKTNNMPRWACCTGTRPQAVSDYHDLIYFHSGDTLYVNLFADSTVSATLSAGAVRLVQRTRFPDDAGTTLTVQVSQPTTFTLAVRVPQWLVSPMTATVNAQATSLTVTSTGWATLNRCWQDADMVRLNLPMGFTLRRFPIGSAGRFPSAVMYGPMVMCLTWGSRNPAQIIDFDHLADNFIPIAGGGATFRLAADPSVIARPYMAFVENEKYFMYLDPAYEWMRIFHTELTFSGPWQSSEDLRYSKNTASYADYAFSGTSLRFRFQYFDDAAYAGISIDGGPVVEVDQYAPWRGLAGYRIIQGLAPGPHTVRVNVLDKRNPASTNGYVNIAGLDIIPDVPVSRVEDWNRID